jgi:hypothetical protein
MNDDAMSQPMQCMGVVVCFDGRLEVGKREKNEKESTCGRA